jgi:hypothetical protein
MVGFDEGLPNPFQLIGIKCLKFLEYIVPASKLKLRREKGGFHVSVQNSGFAM